STVISVALLAHFGGVQAMVRSAKVEKELSGLYVLRLFPGLGALISAALVLHVRMGAKRSGRRHLALFAIAVASVTLNAAYVFLWGSRSVAAVSMLILLAGAWMFWGRSGSSDRTGRRLARARPQWVRMTGIAAVLVAVVVALHFARDHL